MSIYQVTGDRLSKVTNTRQSLRPGQIIQGKILKIYPDNKAQIQLGSQKMIAQLEASLTISGKYHFQVQATDDVIHLKVLGEQLNNQDRFNILNLMQQLGLKGTKSNIAFMQTLISEKIPFEKAQLVQAFQLLDGSKNKVQANQILQQMVAAKLPMTDSIFQAISMKNSSTITKQMSAFLQQLKHDTNQNQLMDRIGQMIERPLNPKSVIVKQIINEVINNNQHFFNTLKAAGAVNFKLDFGTWKSQWETVMKHNNINPQNISNKQISTMKLPFQMNETVIQGLEQINANKTSLINGSQEVIRLWGSKISQAVFNNIGLPGQDFTQLKQQMTQSLYPFFTHEQQQLTKLIQNNPVELRQLLSVLQPLNNKQTYTNLEQFLKQINQDKGFMLATPRDQFLSQVNQTLLFTGLSYENQLANENVQQQATVKGMLMQLLTFSDGTIQERGQQLLHFINGMQLNSVNESNNIIQASLQIPGERLGLTNDLELEFEGSKTEGGELNPDYCRILFYLDLANLKKTVIDMNIQKRSVAITIFNDYDHLKDLSLNLQPMLKEGLIDLNYQLSTVTFKALKKVDDPITPKKSYQPTYQGVDYRI